MVVSDGFGIGSLIILEFGGLWEEVWGSIGKSLWSGLVLNYGLILRMASLVFGIFKDRVWRTGRWRIDRHMSWPNVFVRDIYSTIQ